MTMNVNSEGLSNHYKNCRIRVKTKKGRKKQKKVETQKITAKIKEMKQSLVVCFFEVFSADRHVVFVDLDLGFDFDVGSMISASCCLCPSHDRDLGAPDHDHDLSDTCCLDPFLDCGHEFFPFPVISSVNARYPFEVEANGRDVLHGANHVDPCPLRQEVLVVGQLSAVGREENFWPIHDRC
jgi:hypothetical protein